MRAFGGACRYFCCGVRKLSGDSGGDPFNVTKTELAGTLWQSIDNVSYTLKDDDGNDCAYTVSYSTAITFKDAGNFTILALALQILAKKVKKA